MNDPRYSDHYSDTSFWDKVKTAARLAGREVVEKALVLYYVLRDPDTPKWAKTVVIGALGYFIVPLDAIPDLTPLVGYSDDLGALAAALTTVAKHIKPEHLDRARQKVIDLFGDDSQ